MTPKEYLKQAAEIAGEIEDLNEQIANLESRSERATGAYTALRISGTPNRSNVESVVVDYGMADLRTELRIKLARRGKIYREIMAVIAAVENPTYRRLLTLRYLCDLPWERVAEKMGYSDRWVRGHMHGEALKLVIVPCSSG